MFKIRGIPKEMPCSQVDSRKEKKVGDQITQGVAPSRYISCHLNPPTT